LRDVDLPQRTEGSLIGYGYDGLCIRGDWKTDIRYQAHSDYWLENCEEHGAVVYAVAKPGVRGR